MENEPIYKLPPHKYTHLLTSLSKKNSWHIVQTDFPNIWKNGKGDNITVMVIDTGWHDHRDMKGKNKQGISTVPNVPVNDGEGHGTCCAGVICADNLEFGAQGVAPHTEVISVKALGNDGSGANEWVCKALDYAIEQKPDIVSMSLGAPQKSDAMHQRIKKLYEMNIPVICAAGNSGARGVDYPAAFPETIAVAAYDKNGNIANFSAVGDMVEWAAPGKDIYTTFLNHNYTTISGTSFACPFFAGVVALLLSKHKKQEAETGKTDCKTVAEIRQHLLKYTTDKGVVGRDKHFGYGVVDVETMMMSTLSQEEKNTLPISKDPIRIRIRNFFYRLFSGFLK